MIVRNRGWLAVILACAPAAWAADCPGVHSTLGGALSGTVTFNSNSTSWILTSGTATLQPADCNKKTSFRATPQASPSTDGTGSASVSSATFPYQLQQASGASWSAWGNLQSSSSSNGIVVNGNNTTAVGTRIVAGNSAPAFPRAGTYTDSVAISRDTTSGNGDVDSVGVETLSPGISITVPFQCVLNWTNGISALVLNYTSFGSVQSDAIELNVQCNDTYDIGLAETESVSNSLSLTRSALGLSYTLTLSGNATGNGPELITASKRTITASAAASQSGTAPVGALPPDVTCPQTSGGPGGCAKWSTTRIYYVVISK